MSVIQTIRDKAAWIIIGAIALALIAFIAQDAFQGGGGMGLLGGRSTTLGKVNGHKIDYRDFELRVKQAEDNYQAQNYPVNDQLRNQIREGIWDEFVKDAILNEDFEDLGLTVTDKELGDILYGNNPPQQLRQSFTDSLGRYDAMAAQQAIRSIPKNSAQYNSFWGQFIPAIIKNRQREKFIGMMGNSTYVPKWLVEKTNAENSQLSSISYVYVPYMTISDSTVNVTDEDVKKYVAEHKENFKQEEARGMQYVMFDAAASATDSAEVARQLENLKDTFATANDIQNFLLTHNSQSPYYDGYLSRKEIKIPMIDSIVNNTAEGGVYGPYVDGNAYAMARVVGKRILPDTVKVRHILVATHDRNQQTGTMIPVRADSTARNLIDSLQGAIRNGTPFDSLVAKFSDDPGSKDKGGVYENIVTGGMTPAFNDFIFTNPTGSKGIVKTEFGFHYIEILSQKGASPAYKIAYFSLPILPSDRTITSASGLASQFAGESRTYEQFKANAEKQKLQVINAFDIKPMDQTIIGLGDNRDLVKWMFNDAEKGKVADQPFFVGEKYIVPVLTHIYEEGTMDVEKARPLVEYKIRNIKKAEVIKQKIGNANTIEAVAQATGQPVAQADSISFSSNIIPGVGQEPKVVGAAFNESYKAKPSPAIAGEMGVYVIKVNNISATSNPDFDAEQQRQALQMQMKNNAGYRSIDILQKAATIKDFRREFY